MKLIDILVRELPKRGGWPIDSNGCRQFPDGEVCFSNVGKKPDFYTECATDVDLVWRKTVTHHVSREQYEAALAAKNEGWIEWGGGKCPVQTGVLVDVRYGDGVEEFALEANKPSKTRFRSAAAAWWRKDGSSGDIIAYRLHQPRQTEQPEASEEDLNECIGQAPSAVCSGEWLPSAGCECEYQYKVHGSEWCSFECVAIDGNAAFGWSNNTPIALQLNTHNFRPLRTDAERKRDEAIEEMIKIATIYTTKYLGLDLALNSIYDAIAAGKVPGVKLED